MLAAPKTAVSGLLDFLGAASNRIVIPLSKPYLDKVLVMPEL